MAECLMQLSEVPIPPEGCEDNCSRLLPLVPWQLSIPGTPWLTEHCSCGPSIFATFLMACMTQCQTFPLYNRQVLYRGTSLLASRLHTWPARFLFPLAFQSPGSAPPTLTGPQRARRGLGRVKSAGLPARALKIFRWLGRGWRRISCRCRR